MVCHERSQAKCVLLILVGVTDPTALKSQPQSLVLIPRYTHGVDVVRNLPVFDHMSEPNLHSELVFTNVRVPASTCRGEEGEGFAIG